MQQRETTGPGALPLAAFLGATMIGGGNYIAVKFSNEELDPLFGAALRFATAAVVMFAIIAAARYEVPRGRAALGAVIYGLLAFGTTYGLLYFALVGLNAGTASVIIAAAPLATLAVAVAAGQERFSTRGLVGGGLVVAGFAILSIEELGGDIRPIYLIAAIAGVLSIAASTVVIKGYPQAHPVVSNAIGMSAGALLLAMGSLVFREQWALPATGRTWAVLGWLVAFGSVGMFIMFLYVVQSWTASATVYAVTLMPIVAITLGALIADEQVTLPIALGAALVIAAVYVGALRPERSRDEDLEQCLPEALPAASAPQAKT